MNISFHFNINNSKKSSTGVTIDIEVDMSRDCSISLNINSFRALLTYFYAFFIEYAECVKAIANNTI